MHYTERILQSISNPSLSHVVLSSLSLCILCLDIYNQVFRLVRIVLAILAMIVETYGVEIIIKQLNALATKFIGGLYYRTDVL